VDRGYEVYCLADSHFYESPMLARGNDVDFEVARRPLPAGWKRTEFDDWLALDPEGVRLPAQGWKIHASARLDNAEQILTAIWDYCVAQRIPFKFVRSEQLLFLRNLKYSSRSSSGKFVTIYPADEGQLEVVLTELGAVIDGQAGPYILSDLRWGAGPLYVRYGGFAERYCVSGSGDPVLAIEDGDGRLVPDPRGATFQVPPWVALPDCLAPHLRARASATVADLPYRIEGALHFSNGGGVYTGTDLRSEERVVLKEARPHAGLSMDRADAVARLQHEREMLELLAGLDVVPALRDYFTLGDHHFLVQDYIEGPTLGALIVRRIPLLSAERDEKAAAEYVSWALDTYGRVERAVAALHDRGVVIGDLHTSNMLVRPDGRIAIIDLEGATRANEDRRQRMADAAFMAPATQTGVAIDRYALASLRLFLFLPLTSLLAFDSGKADDLAAAIAEAFPVPAPFLSEAVHTIKSAHASADGASRQPPPRLEPDAAGWRRARHSMAQAILASATPDRKDRLFPGDVKQFFTNGLNLAYGAAGVLYALHETGAGRYPEHEEWLVRRAANPQPGTRLGFYDGLHGVAHTLQRLDRPGDALHVLDICHEALKRRWEHLGLDLSGGLAGIGLNLTWFAAQTGDASLWDAVWDVVDVVADRLGDESSVAALSGGEHPYAGLLRGSSGPALLFLRLYEHTGDGRFLDLAATAIRQDLRRCVAAEGDTLEVNEGWRTMPYVADGSVGVGFVLDDYLAHREDERFARAAPAIRRAARGQLYVEPGLFYGRSGMILYLGRARAPETAGVDPVVAGHVRRLAWHALTYRGHLAFPGEFLLRLSMDLASGTAGVMLALGAALHDEPVHLPFLAPAGSYRVAPSSDLALTTERR
jgi:tRNA A-37 threonylcarbamoyl transferase component Bud32